MPNAKENTQILVVKRRPGLKTQVESEATCCMYLSLIEGLLPPSLPYKKVPKGGGIANAWHPKKPDGFRITSL